MDKKSRRRMEILTNELTINEVVKTKKLQRIGNLKGVHNSRAVKRITKAASKRENIWGCLRRKWKSAVLQDVKEWRIQNGKKSGLKDIRYKSM